MTTAGYRRIDLQEREDDMRSYGGSDVSTLKAVSVRSFGSNRTYTRRVNSATSVVNEMFKKKIYDSDSDDEIFDDYDSPDEETKRFSTMKVGRIDLSPEAEKKRQEAYEKWLNSVISREKERKRVEREHREAEIQKLKEKEDELRSKSGVKVAEWMRKKEIEAGKKMIRLEEAKKALVEATSKPKEFKKAINYRDWVAKKNEGLVLKKKAEEEKQKAAKTSQNCRKSVSNASFEKWMRSASFKAKPVPMSKGLDSLRGSTTKLYINPEPWKYDD